MSRNAARAFIAGGFGVAVGLAVAVDLGVALVADSIVGLGFVATGGGEFNGGEPALEPGADGEQATVRTSRESAAKARRIPRPYVAQSMRVVSEVASAAVRGAGSSCRRRLGASTGGRPADGEASGAIDALVIRAPRRLA